MSEVLTTRDGAVLTITLNRPDVFNAFNRALHAALRAALEEAADPAVRAVVITGAGRGFSAGQDLREFSEIQGSLGDALEQTYHPNIRLIRGLEKPVIAAVNGPAAGAGLSLASACDVRVASTAATFVPGFVGHRPRAGFGRILVPPPPARLRARLRVDELEPQARRRGGARLGARLRGDPCRGVRRPRGRAGRNVGCAADARDRNDEAAVRARIHRVARGAAGAARPSCRRPQS